MVARLCLACVAVLLSCSQSHREGDPDAGADADADTDSDVDADADSDADGDADVCFGACDPGACCNPPWDGTRRCTDLATDWGNCGACGRQCGDAQYCEGGRCICWEMDPSSPLEPCGAACVDLGSDPANCGACGRACEGETPVCRGGVCLTCEEVGLVECGGECTRVEVDDRHCGECGQSCEEGTQCVAAGCVGGECEVECGAGSVCCDHVWGGARGCTDLRTDSFNCGACASRCLQGEECVEGSCGCSPWQTDCGGICVDLQSDTVNCGECDNECGPGAPLCVTGDCAPCETWGLVECAGGACAYLDWDQNNCGECGRRCDPDQYCDAGTCQDADWG
ncbi:MAG: hypothetical protein HYY06_03055 [Deltaproteobacteria bacterium]|nr:hypothetical protein [Deltaproteobacteria bacterium]